MIVSISAINLHLGLRITVPQDRHPYWGVVEYADAIADRLRPKSIGDLRTISVLTGLTAAEIAVIAMEALPGVRGRSIYAKNLDIKPDGQVLVDSQLVGRVAPEIARWALGITNGNGQQKSLANAA